MPHGASVDAWLPVPANRFSVPPGRFAQALLKLVVPATPAAASRSATVAKLTGTFRLEPSDSHDRPRLAAAECSCARRASVLATRPWHDHGHPAMPPSPGCMKLSSVTNFVARL